MRIRIAAPTVLLVVAALVAGWTVAPAGAVIDGEVTFGFSKYDGSLANGADFDQTIEADDSTDQLTFTDWRIDEHSDPDFGVNLKNGGPDSVFSDPAGDSFHFVSFTTEVFCSASGSFDVVGYEDGSEVSGATESFSFNTDGGPTTRSVGFASVDEVRFENYVTDNDNQCLTIDDIVVDQAVTSNTAPSFANLDATVVYDEAAGTPVVVDADATVSDAEHDGTGDYAGSTLTVAREGGANGDDDFGFDTSAGTFTVSGSDLLTGGNVFASFTDSGGTLTIDFDSNEAVATPGLVDDVLQAITYANTGDPSVVEYGLTLAFDDGDAGGALQTSQSLPAEFDPYLTPIATSTTIDFTDLGPVLSNQDTVDARNIDELLFYGFDFGDAAESGAIDSNELQLEHATSDPATTPTRFEADDPFTLDSIDVDNFASSAQDVTLHGYNDGSLVGSETFNMVATSGYQTEDIDGLDAAFLAVDEVRLTASDSNSVAIDNVVLAQSNQPPTVDLDTGAVGTDSTAAFAENDHQGTAASDGVAVTGPVAASDPDGTIETVTLTLDNPQGDASEGLAVETAPLSPALDFTTTANQVTVTRNTASNAELVAAIEAVRFQDDDDAPDETTRTVTVEVSDDAGGTASATATVTVEAGNDAPSITAPGGTLQPDEDIPFDLDGANQIHISDPDAGGATIEVSLSANHGTLTLGSTTGLAFDSGSNGADSFTISGTLSDLNTALATLDYQGHADYFGPDTLSATVNDRGNTGTDPGQTGDGSSEADSTTVSLDVQSVPDAPTISAITDQTTDEDQSIDNITFTVDDAETAAGSLTLSFSADDPALIDSHTFGGSGGNRVLEIVPAADQNGATLVTVEVSDGSLTAEEEFLLTIDAVNDAPTITSAPSDDTVDEDANVPTISFDVDDVETAPGALTVTASSDDQTLVPDANLALSGSGTDRHLDVTLAENQSGTATITLTVDDGTDTHSESFQLTVNAVNDAPAITNIPADSVLEDSAYAYTPTVTDPDVGDTTTFSIENEPAWAGFDESTGELSGTPTNDDVGNHTGIEITVTDDGGDSDTVGPFWINVSNVNDPPTISGMPAGSVDQDALYSFTPTATDVDAGDSLTFSIDSKPSWANFDTDTGELSGTPTNDDVGTYNGIEITVVDLAGTSDSLGPFSVTVTDVNDAPMADDDSYTTVEDTPLSVADPGVLDNDTDIDGDALTATVVANATNGILTMDTDGGFDYTPDADFEGTDGFTYEVSDGNGANDTAAVTITVTPVNDAPWFENNATLAPIKNSVRSSNNDGSRVDSDDLFGDAFEDVDEGDALAGIVVTDDNATAGQGTWQYSTDDGSTWYAVDDGNLSASEGLLLSNETRLRFTPVKSYVGDAGNLTVHAVDDSNAPTFTNGSDRETYDTTADGPSAVAAATGSTVGITVERRPTPTPPPSTGPDEETDPSDGAMREIADDAPDVPGTNVEYDGNRFVRSVSFDGEGVSGTIELVEYDEPPASATERIAEQYGDDDGTTDDGSGTTVLAVVEISPTVSGVERSSATVVFTLPRASVADPESLVVLHETANGTWERIDTAVRETDDTELTVVATVDSFSRFAVVEMAASSAPTTTATGTPTPTPGSGSTTRPVETATTSASPTSPVAPTSTDTDGMPGFGLVVAVVALITATLLAARRQSQL